VILCGWLRAVMRRLTRPKMTNADLLKLLWKHAHAEGADYIVYSGKIDASEHHLGGVFYPNPHNRQTPRPQVWIFRDESPLPNPNNAPALTGAHVLQDTLVLAHELGHFRSWKERQSTPEWIEYFEAAKARDRGEKLTERQIDLILGEERLASSHGRELLARHRFADLDAYDRREEESLAGHRKLMGRRAAGEGG
jgi:hypothetical protein